MTENQVSDAELLNKLAGLYQKFDPAPPQLAANVLAVIAAEEIVSDALLLELVGTDELIGARGDTRSIQFRNDDKEILLRVENLGGGRVRIDGWVTPIKAATVVLTVGGKTLQTTLVQGRFEFSSVPAGMAELSIEFSGGKPWSTRGFEI